MSWEGDKGPIHSSWELYSEWVCEQFVRDMSKTSRTSQIPEAHLTLQGRLQECGKVVQQLLNALDDLPGKQARRGRQRRRLGLPETMHDFNAFSFLTL